MTDAERPRARVGTSGFTYDNWKGAFYPKGVPKRKWLEYYATRFDAVELNASFYRLPSPQVVDGWRSRTTDDFRFVFKMSRLATHVHKLALPKAAEAATQLLMLIRPLGPRLGPVLVQLPPSLERNTKLLDAFFAALPRDFTYALEVRHPSWFEKPKALTEVLTRHGAAFARSHSPDLETPLLDTAPFAYYRFHGTREASRGPYGNLLEDWAREMGTLAEQGKALWAFFNNDLEGDAPVDAALLASLLGVSLAGREVEEPPRPGPDTAPSSPEGDQPPVPRG